MNEKISVLIADDETRIRNLLKLFFEKEGWEVVEASDGWEAVAKVTERSFDIVVLDLMMPKMDGWTACPKIREARDIPIIMLTARGEESDRILGFELGADDYVVKPFSPKELVMRIKALLRRSKKENRQKDKSKRLVFPGLNIDATARTVALNDIHLNLTPIEFDLLYFLASKPGRAYSREQLLENVWGYDYYGDARTVDTHIKRLREKLNDKSKWIATVWGVGYKFEVM